MNANGRRARQAKMGFKNLARRQRPNYRVRDLASSVRHEMNLREKAKSMQARKGKKK